MIKTNNLSKRYGEIGAVKNVSLHIRRGEIVGLLGQNGAGKTTMMKMITGYLEPSEGTVSLGGVDVLSDRVEVQKKIGYMPENAPLYPDMLVQDYLAMIASLRGIPADRRIPMILEAVKATGLGPYLTRPIGTLSKGYRQRVGICQAIVHKPDVLILDEPTNGLDPVQIVEIRNLIRSLAKDSTVILSTHILQEIEAVCDRVLILIDGALVKDAPLREFLDARHIQLVIEDRVTMDDLKQVAATIPSIGEIRPGDGPHREGFSSWSIEWQGAEAPVPEILEQAAAKHWKVASAAAIAPSLESAFSALMLEHATRNKKEDAA